MAISQASVRKLQERFAAAVGEATRREDGPLLYVRLAPEDAAMISYCMGYVDGLAFDGETKAKGKAKGKT